MTSKTFCIDPFPADGTGKGVSATGQKAPEVISADANGSFVLDRTEFSWDSEYHAGNGIMMASEGSDQLRDFGASIYGAVGRPIVPDHISLCSRHLATCQVLAQWVNVRPVHFLPGVASPLRKDDDTELIWIVGRENSEGECAGSLGLSSSVPYNPERRFPSMFESVHGFALDLADQRISDPIGTNSGANLMLKQSGLHDEAEGLDADIRSTTETGTRPKELGDFATTEEVTDDVPKFLN